MTAALAARRHVALLRAINVGGHTVTMDRLRALFEELGLDDVRTFIASGNVIFHTDDGDRAGLERRIADHLEAALGYAVATFLRSPAELAAILDRAPFAQQGDGTLYVGFLAAPPPAAAAGELLARSTEQDLFHVHGSELYWLCRTRTSESPFTGAVIERTLGVAATLRNANTVRRIVAKYG